MKYTRSIRRHHYNRKKLQVAKKNYFGHSRNDWHTALSSQLGFYANTPKCWSCDCCSSPRRAKGYSLKEKLTIQERKSKISFKEYQSMSKY